MISSGEETADGIEDRYSIRTWLEVLFRRGRPRIADEASLKSRVVHFWSGATVTHHVTRTGTR
ncbi:hypothetical protein SAMN06272735_0369 [Streptomyces sp. TLI_55]|uniref:hypothetical protein n=1 Tax=Streptomyces sp. TLI_55 TaxID=1938861 RepID=UPI000BD986E3|nr:hypothetical protein [Streptomyces sp. TLI_55]SNX55934.1 hypothetical protein SAMN06272735_0369 [Streptomyces sp. TLI_55]